MVEVRGIEPTVQYISTPIIITGLVSFSLLAFNRLEKANKYPPRSTTNPNFNVLCCGQTKDGFTYIPHKQCKLPRAVPNRYNIQLLL